MLVVNEGIGDLYLRSMIFLNNVSLFRIIKVYFTENILFLWSDTFIIYDNIVSHYKIKIRRIERINTNYFLIVGIRKS